MVNKVLVSLLFSNLLFTTAHAVATHHWSHSDADKWGDDYEMCGSGKMQSPVAIETSKVRFDEKLARNPLIFADYAGTHLGHLTNNGHTVVFELYVNSSNMNASVAQPSISGLVANDTYAFAQLHFHWGDGSPIKGSEHTIDGAAFSLEVHLVHYNLKYRSFAEAQAQHDGLAVVAFLFESKSLITLVSYEGQNRQHSAPISGDGTDYRQFARYLQNVTLQNQDVMMEIDLAKLIPNFARGGDGIFFRYDGSLTTPPCYESVTWTVFEDRIRVDADFFIEFLKLRTTKIDPKTRESFEGTLSNNFRPVQPLGRRRVKTNRPKAEVMAVVAEEEYGVLSSSSPSSTAAESANEKQHPRAASTAASVEALALSLISTIISNLLRI